MRNVVTTLSLAFFFTGFLWMTMPARTEAVECTPEEEASSYATICHSPTGAPQDARTICINEGAVETYLKNYSQDTLGACPPACGDGIQGYGEDCDDGGLCEGGSRNGLICNATQTATIQQSCPFGQCIQEDNDGCTNDCNLEPVCGNGVTQIVGIDGRVQSKEPGEECDYGSFCDNGHECDISKNLIRNKPSGNSACGRIFIGGRFVLGTCGPRDSKSCTKSCTRRL